jgi:predicted ArsR family transcriptional regulator
MESARMLLAELVKQGLGKFHIVPTTGRPAEAFRLYEAGDRRQENPAEHDEELPSPDEEESDSPF